MCFFYHLSFLPQPFVRHGTQIDLVYQDCAGFRFGEASDGTKFGEISERNLNFHPWNPLNVFAL